MYKNNYDEVLLELNSRLEKVLFIEIRDKATRDNPTILVNQTKLADKFGTTKSTVNRLIRKLEKIGFIKKVGLSAYRMNPFICLPYQADGKKLQDEWENL